MIECRLNLRSEPAAVHAPAAWFIPGADSAAWLAEIARWAVPTASLRLYVLPNSMADRSPAGVLVAGAQELNPALVERAQAYGLLSRRLFLPVHATLDPPLMEAELFSLLKLPVQVFHPAIGLVGFEDRDALGVHELLESPAERKADWDHAAAGVASTPRIRSVEPLHPPQLSLFFEQGRDDIGSEAPDELPPAPEESPNLDRARRSLAGPALSAASAAISPLRLLAWLSEKLRPRGTPSPPTTGNAPIQGASTAGPGWARRLHERLSAKLAAMSRDLFDQRRRALERLKRMLAEDPDEGLRHAISLRHFEGRGVATPSADLPTRDVSFHLPSAMGGGGRPTDAWDIAPDTIQTLTQQYRDAANRELRLGRYRRAAYIFAELLGDYSSAANALEQGRCYREAAALYRDPLANPQRAAKCLQAGGLLVEAAAIWVELKEFETAGDLYVKIDRNEDALSCYRQAVSALITKADFVSAAKLLETKIGEVDSAVRLLESAWPDHQFAAHCLVAYFDLIGRHGRHEAAKARVSWLRKSSTPSHLEVPLIQTLCGVATGYSDRDVRDLAADTTRVLSSRTLPAASFTQARQIVQALATLVPQDRLLGRDVARYVEHRPARPAGMFARGVAVVRQLRLSQGMSWHAVTPFETGFCAAQVENGVAVLLAQRWSGEWDATRQPISGESVELCCVPARCQLLTASVFFTGFLAVLLKAAAAGHSGATEAVTLSRPSWLPRFTRSIAANESAVVWALHGNPARNDSAPSLNAYALDAGQLVGSHALPSIEWPDESRPPMVAVRDEVYAGWGQQGLLCFVPLTAPRIEPTPSPVTALVTSYGQTNRKVLATMEDGCLLIGPRGQRRVFAQEFSHPIATFLRSDKVVVIEPSQNRGRVYGLTDDCDVKQIVDFTIAGGKPFAVIAANQLDQFATFTAEGLVTVYQAPA